MKAELTECTVYEIKFDGTNYLIAIEIAKGVYMNMLCPYEHSWKVGDRVKLYVDVPLVMYDPAKLLGA